MEQLRENTYLRRCIVRVYEKDPGKIAEERSAMHPVKIFILFQSGVGTHKKMTNQAQSNLPHNK